MASKSKPKTPASQVPADAGNPEGQDAADSTPQEGEADTGSDTSTAEATVAAPKKRNMTRGESKHSARRIESVERQVVALEYRKMGLSYAQIAEKMEMGSSQSAWNAVESALKRTLQDGADDVRKLELARLDAMFVPVYGNAIRGDLMALSAALNIMTRRARLLGLDAPERKELTGAGGSELKALPPTVIMIGGPGEEGEPEVMGASVVPPAEPVPA